MGDKIEGKLLEIKNDVGKYHQNVYVLLDSNDKKIEIWGKMQLDKLMMEIEVGDYIRITYNGTKTTGNGYLMNMYYLEKRCDNNGKNSILES